MSDGPLSMSVIFTSPFTAGVVGFVGVGAVAFDCAGGGRIFSFAVGVGAGAGAGFGEAAGPDLFTEAVT